MIVQISRDGGQRQFKLSGLFSLGFLFLASSLFAQSFADFKREQQSEFAQYRDVRDQEFNNYLKSEWEEYTAKNSPPVYENPKPKHISPTVAKKIISVGPKIHIRVPEVQKKESISAKEKQKKKSRDISFVFYGQELSFDIDPKFKRATFYPLNQSGIAHFFDTMASSEYEATLEEIRESIKELNLNDWGVYLLVNQLAATLYQESDERKLFSWFIFNKLGYAVKVGLASKHIVLMHYSQKVIYDTPRYKFGNRLFYVVSSYAKGISQKVYTYKQNYPQAFKPLDMTLKTLPNFQEQLQEKRLSFREYGKEYKFHYLYDKNLIDFMATYPQADYETFFNAPMQEKTYRSLAEELKQYINGKNASVALNFVLNFVQKAFVYEVDQEQFGREKVMFAQETLFYNKSDCEDRAILYSYLVKELFGISVIGVKYSDHMATALYIPMKGDSVKAGKRRFVIADPTYVNANIGESMPKYKSKTPESFIIVRGE